MPTDLSTDLCFSKTGEWTTVEGTTYYSADATVAGNAFHQEAVSAHREFCLLCPNTY